MKVNELTMFDFEVKMRKAVSDFVAPSIERMTRVAESQQASAKATEQLLVRMAELEDAVYNQGRAHSIFEDIKDRITKGEALRRVDNEALKNRMDNVEKMVGD